jgi:hypothetical protein
VNDMFLQHIHGPFVSDQVPVGVHGGQCSVVSNQ